MRKMWAMPPVMGAVLSVMVLMLMPFMAVCGEDQVHHLVGDDRGWDSSADIRSWAAGRTFRVGDDIWFSYSGAIESVVELGSRDEFDSCDLRNPLRLYTEGLDQVRLDSEGSRFFASGRSDNCKNGLKLHINVEPYRKETAMVVDQVAAGPSASEAAGLIGGAVAALPWLLGAASYLLG